MKHAKIHHLASTKVDLQITSSVTLAYDDRHRRRIKMTADDNTSFLLDLEQATYLKEGDLLEFEDGTGVLVKAAKEEVLDITCHTPKETARVAWHVGNRHTPIEVLDTGVMRLRYDHVLQHMIEGLGAHCEKKIAAFSPESGAYKSGGGHGHAHS